MACGCEQNTAAHELFRVYGTWLRHKSDPNRRESKTLSTHGMTRVWWMSHSTGQVFWSIKNKWKFFPEKINLRRSYFCKWKQFKLIRFELLSSVPEVTYLFICYRVTFFRYRMSTWYCQQVARFVVRRAKLLNVALLHASHDNWLFL